MTPTKGPAAVVEQLRGVPGVAYAVVTDKRGACAHDSTARGEDLAGKSAYLAVLGERLGATLRSGQLRSIAVQGRARPMLLLAAKGHYLSVLLEAGADVSSVEAEVRKLLG